MPMLMRLKRDPFLITVHWFRYRVQNGVGRLMFHIFSPSEFPRPNVHLTRIFWFPRLFTVDDFYVYLTQ